MSKGPRIIVIGSANVDLTTFTDDFPKPGQTIFGSDFDLGFGGKGANQAVAARLCGAEVQMVGRVGDDLFGPATMENFRHLGVGIARFHATPGAASGTAAILVDSAGQNRIIVVKGANDLVTPADVDRCVPLLEGCDCLILQLEIPLETVYHAIAAAGRLGVRCILNPAPAAALDFGKLQTASYLIPNESEAEELTGIEVRDVAGAEAAARRLRTLGLSRVVITLGSRGAWLSTPEEETAIPAYPVESRDTTGAGDAFVGSFTVFLAEGLPEVEALRRAALYAALSTQRTGTQKSFLRREEFDREWRDRKNRVNPA